MDFFNEVFHHLPRQGPGAKEATIKAYEIVKKYLPDDPIVLDIGCVKARPKPKSIST